MKKILFASYDLNIGGIETSLVTLLNTLSKNKDYQITLVLEKKQGIFLDQIDKNINIIEYTPSNKKNILIRKLINMLKRIKFVFKYKNKFDFAASYATYLLSASFIARTASKNNAIWVHTDYLTLLKDNKEEFERFFYNIKFNKFKNIIFVSKIAKDNFTKIFPKYQQNITVINNLIDYKRIIELSKENIEFKNKDNYPIFLNVGRHDEESKKLTRIIEASKILAEKGYNFKVLFVGDGPDIKLYRAMVKDNNLEENINFIGQKENPYPYFRICNCVILTSQYEGYPVVFLESKTLNKPIITTKVSDYQDIEEKFGYVTEKNTESIFEAMEHFIKKGYTIKERFDPQMHNEKIIKKIEDIIRGK